MGAINGRVIYSPKGKAGEYAENAVLRWLYQWMHVLLFAQRAGRKSVGRQYPGIEKGITGISIRIGYIYK